MSGFLNSVRRFLGGETLSERCCKWSTVDAAMAECGAAVVFQLDKVAEYYNKDPYLLRNHLCLLLQKR